MCPQILPLPSLLRVQWLGPSYQWRLSHFPSLVCPSRVLVPSLSSSRISVSRVYCLYLYLCVSYHLLELLDRVVLTSGTRNHESSREIIEQFAEVLYVPSADARTLPLWPHTRLHVSDVV